MNKKTQVQAVTGYEMTEPTPDPEAHLPIGKEPTLSQDIEQSMSKYGIMGVITKLEERVARLEDRLNLAVALTWCEDFSEQEMPWQEPRGPHD